ncbi:MAG TPA: AMP-binding protein [Myxococcales bacterium]|jgi:long-chain acyl-CoA synthetase
MPAADPSPVSSQPQVVPPAPAPSPASTPAQAPAGWKTRGEDFKHLLEPLEQAAGRYGAKIALRLRKNGELRTLTWSELLQRIHAAAAALEAAGLRPGDRVVLHAENSPDWLIANYAVLKARGTVVPLDANLPAADLAILLKAAEARLVLFSRAQAPKHVDTGCTAPQLVLEDRLCCATPSVPALAPAKDDPDADPELASIIFTSGTSGRPKGVMLTHSNLLYAGCDGIWNMWGVNDQDELLLVLPLHHIFAGIIQIGALAAGATMTLVEAVRGDLIVAAMQETHTTLLPGVPRLFELIYGNIQRTVAQKGAVTRALFATMKFATRAVRRRTPFNPGPKLFKKVFNQFGGARLRLVSAGAPGSIEVMKGFESMGFSFLEGYGMSETSAAACGSWFRNRRLGRVGHAVPGSEVQIFQPNTAGEGELRVKGRGVMRGYFREPEMTAQVLKDGWYSSGDLGRMDRKGYFKIVGRLDELIVTPAGKKASPDDVERHYKGIEGVKELAVVGMPCGDRPGEEIHAAVVLDPAAAAGVDAAQLRTKVEAEFNERAPEIVSYLRVQRVHFVDEIPKTTKLSVKRKELRKLLESEAKPTKAAADEPAVAEQRDALEERVVALVSQFVPPSSRRGTLSLRSALQFDLGIDSLGRLELASAIEEEFGVPMDELGPSIHRVADLVAAVRKAQSESKPLELAKPGEEVARVPPPRGFFAWIASEAVLWSMRVIWHIDIQGVENLPEKGPFLVCPNHLTYLDPLWLAAVLPHHQRQRGCSFGKAELWKNPITKFLANLGRAIPVEREGDALPALRAGLEVLKSGQPLLMFPEGTRSRSGQLSEFRRGAAKLALASGAPIVPARLIGTYEVWGAHKLLPRVLPHRNFKRMRLQVVIGEPLVATPIADGEKIAAAELELTERLRKAVLELGWDETKEE